MRPLNSLVVAIVIVCCTLSACSIAEPVTPFPTRARMELGDGEASDYPGDSVPVGYLVGKLDGTATIGGGGWGYDTPPDLFEFTGKSQLTGLPYLLRAKAKMTAEIDIFQGSAPGFAYAEAQYSMRCEKLMECEASKSIYVNCASVQVNADGKAHHSTVWNDAIKQGPDTHKNLACTRPAGSAGGPSNRKLPLERHSAT